MLKTDWVTKLLLAGILFFLAVLALKPSAPVVSPAWAQSGSRGVVTAASHNGYTLIATESKWAVIGTIGPLAEIKVVKSGTW